MLSSVLDPPTLKDRTVALAFSTKSFTKGVIVPIDKAFPGLMDIL